VIDEVYCLFREGFVVFIDMQRTVNALFDQENSSVVGVINPVVLKVFHLGGDGLLTEEFRSLLLLKSI